MSVLLVEKINHRFKRITGTKQSSGLSVCLDMIASSNKRINLVQVDNFEHMEHAIQYYKPRKVVIQAIWCSEEELKILRTRYKAKEFFIHIHSNIPFLACEGFAFQRILEAKKQGVGVIFNSKRASDAFPGSLWLPNIYNYTFKDVPRRTQGDTIKVICAGSTRPMKDHVSQALGAILYAESVGKKLVFHANLGRSEGGEEVKVSLKSVFQMYPQHELVSIPWLEHKKFIEYLRDMDFGLQVSMSESFNIVAADYTEAGIPMVVSPEVEWASLGSKVPCGDPVLIASRMNNAEQFIVANRYGLRNFSDIAKMEWEKFCD